MRHRANLAIVFFCLLLPLTGCKQKINRSDSAFGGMSIDSVERCAQDSLFSNTRYSRSLLRHAMADAPDSLSYYYLLSFYSKSYFVTADFDSVLYYNRLVKRFCNEVELSAEVHDLLSTVYNMEGNVLMQRTQPDSAIISYKKAYEERLQGQQTDYLPDLCINLADANVHKGDYAYAAYYYRRALFICDSLGLPDRNKFPVYYGLGQTYMELRDFELSNHYYELAGNFFPQMSVSEKWTYLNNRGNHFYYKKDYPQAVHYIGRALEVVKSYPQMVFEQNLCKANLGELYVITNKLDSAQLYLDESYRFFSGIGNQSALYYIETQMIELALKKGNVALAGDIIRRSADYGHIDANMINIRNHYLQHYYEQVGNYKKAYEYQKHDLQLNDSIRNERVRTRVAELDMRYRQDTIVMRKELVIEKQKGEMEVLKLTTYIWALIGIVSVIVAGLVYWYMKKKRMFLQERHINQISRFRMENIRNRLSPHFIFNVLNREISRFRDGETLCGDLTELVKLLRKSLELTEKLSISLYDELEFVKTYIHLEQGRLGSDFSMDVKIEEDLDIQQVVIPSMVVQIPVENALKHGLAGIDGLKLLGISVCRKGSGILIDICDNGRGYSPQTLSSTRGTGTGLKVLYQTIQLLNDKNREKIRFEIKNLVNNGQTGTQVLIYIPLDYSYNL